MKSDPNAPVYAVGTRDMVKLGMYNSMPSTFEEVIPDLKEGMILQQFALGEDGEALQGPDVEAVASFVAYEGKLVALPDGVNSRLAMLIAHDVTNRLDLSEVEMTMDDLIDQMDREASAQDPNPEAEEEAELPSPAMG